MRRVVATFGLLVAVLAIRVAGWGVRLWLGRDATAPRAVHDWAKRSNRVTVDRLEADQLLRSLR